MWVDWRPEIIERDLRELSHAGLKTLRVFPLWSDFQPVMVARGFHGSRRELLLRPWGGVEQSLPDTQAGRAGVDAVMLDRFAEFADIARRHGMELIVGLITGWMSGRTFIPPAADGLALHTDPVALQLQGRFIRCFVQRFAQESAIIAWDLGNECNCLGPVPCQEAAWTWTAFVTGTIRSFDCSRPVISGMHTLEPTGHWTIQDQAEHCDLLTTHPYPLWSRHTAQDPIDGARTTFHATAETSMYADIGGRPALAEEIGTMGPMMGDWESATRFVRINLFSLWANDCLGFLWWCAFDQRRLHHAPYTWIGVERELGLFDEDHRPKPMVRALTEFSDFLNGAPVPLPPRRVDAVCILTRGQDAWAVAYAAWILAAQSRISIQFAWAEAPLPDASRYLVPSMSGIDAFPRQRWLDLLARVHAGAELLVTLDDGVVEPFTDIFGVQVTARSHRRLPTSCDLGGQSLTATHGPDLRLAAESGTTVLATAPHGGAMMTSRAYGRGSATLIAFPVERQLTLTPGGVDGEAAQPLHLLYRKWSASLPRRFDVDQPLVEMSDHGERWAVFINHGLTPARISFQPGTKPLRWLRGGPLLAGHDVAVVEYEA